MRIPKLEIPRKEFFESNRWEALKMFLGCRDAATEFSSSGGLSGGRENGRYRWAEEAQQSLDVLQPRR